MKERNTSDRLKEIMAKNGLRQIDILNKAIPFCKKYNVKLGRNDLSQYISGKVEPSQKKLTVLAEALEVNEAWLMGYDTDKEEINSFDELELLFDKNKNILTEDDKQYIKFIIEKRKKDIDKQLGKEE